MSTEQYREYGGLDVHTPYVGFATVTVGGGGNDRKVHLDRNTAREVGTYLIRCAGTGVTGREQWEPRPDATLLIRVVDGQVEVAASVDGKYADVGLSQDEAVDAGQRLIVWAGVDMRHAVA